MHTYARQEVDATIIDRNGVPVGFRTYDGGLLDVSVSGPGLTDEQGFYIVLSSAATEGLLYVKPWSSSEYKLLPFFKGFNNMLIKSVIYNASNTATSVYWVK